MIRPPIIYLGNKYRFLSSILPLIHPKRTLIEPFVGSGAVFLNSKNENVIINDLNKDIIDLHNHIRFCFPELIRKIEEFCQEKHDNAETYYQFRERFNNLGSCVEKTALFLYINYYGFKGLIRYSKGRINVPFHQGFAISNYSFKKIHEAHQAIKTKKLELFSRDFRDILTPKYGVTVYADPPYLPSDGKIKCESYLGRTFGITDHQDLINLAEEYRKLGSTFIISNHLTELSRNLYKNADQIIELSRKTGVQHNSQSEIQKECLVVYGSTYSQKCKLV